MTDLQSKLLEMLTWLDSFIRKNNLVYYVVGGTLIGAARHSGFIPWDDDIDIALPRRDYEKLCELLKEPIEHYIIESPQNGGTDFLYTFAKFYDIDTTMTEVLKEKITRGVYIDIFPLDGMGNSLEEAKKNYKRVDRLNMFLMTRICAIRAERKWYKNLAICIARMIPSALVNERRLVDRVDLLNQRYSYDEKRYVSLTMSTYRTRDIHNKELLGTPVELPFENIKVLAPERYDEYLTDSYGNWRQLPPEDKRRTAHDFVELDMKKSYYYNNK